MEALIKFQMISPSVTYGRCTDSWRWNSLEYRPPIATAVVPVAMVIQNGPNTERRYRCLMSCQPKCSHNSRRRYPSTRSPQARVIVLDCAAASTIVMSAAPSHRDALHRRRRVSSRILGALEFLPTPQPAQPQPLQQTLRVTTGHQEKPAEPQPFLTPAACAHRLAPS